MLVATFLVCSMTAPDQCETYNLRFIDVVTQFGCLMSAQMHINDVPIPPGYEIKHITCIQEDKL